MGEECLVTGVYKFKRDDYVAIASMEACSFIKRSGVVHCNRENKWFFDKIGKVNDVTPLGDVIVTFGRVDKCAIPPQYLVKLRDLSPGDLVKLVDDIRPDGNLVLENREKYRSATEVCGHICLVLLNCFPKNGLIYVTLGQGYDSFSPFHLDFVARPLYGDFMARVNEYAGKKDVSQCLADNLFTALRQSMQDLPSVHRFASSKSSPYVPGNIVKVSADVIEFIRWKMIDSPRETGNPGTTKFQTLQDYASSGLDYASNRPFPTEQVVSLNQRGRVVHVDMDGDTIVEFNDGRAWSIRSCFLQLVEDCDAYFEGPRTSPLGSLSEAVDKFIRHAHSSDPEKAKTLLHAACFSGNTTLVDFFLGGQLGVECEDENGNRPLHYATHGNQPGVIKLLLSKRADINATNQKSHTALHFAVKEGFVDCVRVLTKEYQTLDANIQDDMGNTALHVAVATTKPEIVGELVNLPEVDFLLSDQYGLNALHTAALKGNAVVAEKILARKNDLINLKQEDQGYAALHFAAVSGHYDLVETLLEEQACMVDLLNKHEETALLLAAKEGHWSIVESLLLAGASINKKDRHGNTALHISLMEVHDLPDKLKDIPTSLALTAVKKKLEAFLHTEACDTLLLPCFLARCGADTRCPNKAGKTPFDLVYGYEGRAAELLGYFSFERMNVDSDKCKFCFEAPADVYFKPCGHRLYCEECGWRMKRCLTCGIFISRVVPASSRSTSNPLSEKIEVIQAVKPVLGPEVYPMQRKPRGLCIIINNVDFLGSTSRREGSEKDSQRMKSLFTALHFDVRVHTNQSAQEMLEVLSTAANAEEQKKADCLAVILMSHGRKDLIFGVDNRGVHLHDEVYKLFNNKNCPALKGKPKLFFIQACRRRKENDVTDEAADFSGGDAGSLELPHEWSDMYFAYATIPDYVAIRDTYNGSWFISAISKVFSQYAAVTDLDGLMRKVAHDVMQHSTRENVVQTTNPEQYGWTKRLYFNPGH